MAITRERNYRKYPHTARFLMTFHKAAAGLPSDIEPQENAVTTTDPDLLDSVVDAPAAPIDRRTEAQASFMESLIGEITELDTEAGEKARGYTDRMTAAGKWTPGRSGNTSDWINRMITKRGELREAAKKAETSAPALPQVPDGRYAVELNGVVKFFRLKNGRKPGFVFLDAQASGDLHPVRNLTYIRKVVSLIAQDPKAAMIRYGHELGVCGMCGRVLTDETSRAAGIGPVCQAK